VILQHEKNERAASGHVVVEQGVQSTCESALVLSYRWRVVAEVLEDFACLSIEDDIRVSEPILTCGRRNLFATGINHAGTRVEHTHLVKGHDPDRDVFHGPGCPGQRQGRLTRACGVVGETRVHGRDMFRARHDHVAAQCIGGLDEGQTRSSAAC